MDYDAIQNEARRLFVEIVDRFELIPRNPSVKPSDLVKMLCNALGADRPGEKE